MAASNTTAEPITLREPFWIPSTLYSTSDPENHICQGTVFNITRACCRQFGGTINATVRRCEQKCCDAYRTAYGVPAGPNSYSFSPIGWNATSSRIATATAGSSFWSFATTNSSVSANASANASVVAAVEEQCANGTYEEQYCIITPNLTTNLPPAPSGAVGDATYQAWAKCYGEYLEEIIPPETGLGFYGCDDPKKNGEKGKMASVGIVLVVATAVLCAV